MPTAIALLQTPQSGVELGAIAGPALVLAGVLLAIAALGLLLQGKSRTVTSAWIGLAGLILIFATVAATRRLEADAQAWIAFSLVILCLELWLFRVCESMRVTAPDDTSMDEERDAS